MQLAAFLLCVISVICGRIFTQEDASYIAQMKPQCLPYITQEDLIYLRENNQIRVLYQSARTPTQINSDKRMHFTLSNVTKKESYRYGLNIKKASPPHGERFSKDTHACVKTLLNDSSNRDDRIKKYSI